MSTNSSPPRPGRRILAGVLAWVAVVSGAHLALNVDWTTLTNSLAPLDKRKFNVAYIPVT